MPDENKKSRWDYLGKEPKVSQDPILKQMISFQDTCKDCKWCRIAPSENPYEMVCILYGEKGFSPERPVPEKCMGKVEKKY